NSAHDAPRPTDLASSALSPALDYVSPGIAPDAVNEIETEPSELDESPLAPIEAETETVTSAASERDERDETKTDRAATAVDAPAHDADPLREIDAAEPIFGDSSPFSAVARELP